MGYCLLGVTYNQASAEYLFTARSRYKDGGDRDAREKCQGENRLSLGPIS